MIFVRSYDILVHRAIIGGAKVLRFSDKAGKPICWHCIRTERTLNTDGLCSACAEIVAADIDRIFTIINGSYKIIAATNNVDTFLSRYELYKNMVQKLIDYSAKGIKFTDECIQLLQFVEDSAHRRVADFTARKETEIINGKEIVTEYAKNGRAIRRVEREVTTETYKEKG